MYVCVCVSVCVVCPATFHTTSKDGAPSALKCINNGVKCLSARKYQSHGLASPAPWSAELLSKASTTPSVPAKATLILFDGSLQKKKIDADTKFNCRATAWNSYRYRYKQQLQIQNTDTTATTFHWCLPVVRVRTGYMYDFMGAMWPPFGSQTDGWTDGRAGPDAQMPGARARAEAASTCR